MVGEKWQGVAMVVLLLQADTLLLFISFVMMIEPSGSAVR
jgi:hypothetical protein